MDIDDSGHISQVTANGTWILPVDRRLFQRNDGGVKTYPDRQIMSVSYLDNTK